MKIRIWTCALRIYTRRHSDLCGSNSVHVPILREENSMIRMRMGCFLSFRSSEYPAMTILVGKMIILRNGILRSHPHGPMAKSQVWRTSPWLVVWFKGTYSISPCIKNGKNGKKPWFESGFRKIHILIHRDI